MKLNNYQSQSSGLCIFVCCLVYRKYLKKQKEILNSNFFTRNWFKRDGYTILHYHIDTKLICTAKQVKNCYNNNMKLSCLLQEFGFDPV